MKARKIAVWRMPALIANLVLIAHFVFADVFCPKCGQKCGDAANFCQKCGNKLPKGTADTKTSKTKGTPGVDKIKADLIGRTMGGLLGWKFASLSEFEDVAIDSEKTVGDILEYGVGMRLKDARSGTRYRAEAIVVYRKTDDKWQFASVSQKRIEKVAHSAPPRTGEGLTVDTGERDPGRRTAPSGLKTPHECAEAFLESINKGDLARFQRCVSPEARESLACYDPSLMTCRDRLTAIGEAMTRYLDEYGDDGRFPKSLAALVEKGLLKKELLLCPSDRDPKTMAPGVRTSYQSAFELAKKQLDDTLPGEWICCWDKPGNHRSQRNVLCFDGRTKAWPQEYFRSQFEPSHKRGVALVLDLTPQERAQVSGPKDEGAPPPIDQIFARLSPPAVRGKLEYKLHPLVARNRLAKSILARLGERSKCFIARVTYPGTREEPITLACMQRSGGWVLEDLQQCDIFQRQCKSNLWNLMVSCRHYVSGHGKHRYYPKSLADLIEKGVITEPTLYTCPLDADPKVQSSKTSGRYPVRLEISYDSIFAFFADSGFPGPLTDTLPGNWPAIWDREPRHDGKMLAAFLDSGVRLISTEQLESFRESWRQMVRRVLAKEAGKGEGAPAGEGRPAPESGTGTAQTPAQRASGAELRAQVKKALDEKRYKDAWTPLQRLLMDERDHAETHQLVVRFVSANPEKAGSWHLLDELVGKYDAAYPSLVALAKEHASQKAAIELLVKHTKPRIENLCKEQEYQGAWQLVGQTPEVEEVRSNLTAALIVGVRDAERATKRHRPLIEWADSQKTEKGEMPESGMQTLAALSHKVIGEFSAAAKCLDRAATLRPDDWQPPLYLAIVQANITGQDGNAMASYRKALGKLKGRKRSRARYARQQIQGDPHGEPLLKLLASPEGVGSEVLDTGKDAADRVKEGFGRLFGKKRKK